MRTQAVELGAGLVEVEVIHCSLEAGGEGGRQPRHHGRQGCVVELTVGQAGSELLQGGR